jgi:hypothetical protein
MKTSKHMPPAVLQSTHHWLVLPCTLASWPACLAHPLLQYENLTSSEGMAPALRDVKTFLAIHPKKSGSDLGLFNFRHQRRHVSGGQQLWQWQQQHRCFVSRWSGSSSGSSDADAAARPALPALRERCVGDTHVGCLADWRTGCCSPAIVHSLPPVMAADCPAD